MSGVCYSDKNSKKGVTTTKDKTTKSSEQSESKYDSNKHDNIEQLLEYETMVASAENKCSQLKGQLEKIKQFYNNQSELKKSLQTKDAPLKERINASFESYAARTNVWAKAAKKIRQNSQAIGTDTSGAPLGTINNILAGITKPLQLSDFSHKKDFNKYSSNSETDKYYQEQLHGVDEVKINSKSKKSICIRSKSKCSARKSKSKIIKISSLNNIKKSKKPVHIIASERRRSKGSDTHLKKIAVNIPKKPTTKMLKSFLPSGNTVKENYTARSEAKRNQDLVEIYHNNAVKETKSSDSDITKKKCQKVEKPIINVDLVPPLNINADEINPNQEPRQVVSMYRNYAMPTIASRMKRVAKCYMNMLSKRSIPFCLSTSTSPSHNIGINIQQVMSMVKSKQPIGRLSPTLAYNIGLAAGKKDDEALPFLVSSVTSKTFNPQCPLSKIGMNFQQLQEVAKCIPQDIIEEGDETEEVNSPETQSVIITGPSGEVKVRNKKRTPWTANCEEKKCTCVTPKGLTFQQIINKFNGSVYKNNKLTFNTPIKVNVQNIEGYSKSSSDIPLRNKEKKLKEVLGKLHDEFEQMTLKYEDLAKKNENDATDPAVLKELETLDKQLNSKEEEIVMVMSLYKEVLALKQQVKSLKERTSKENISVNQPSTYNGPVNDSAAGLLNKLLQQVQHYQTHYKAR